MAHGELVLYVKFTTDAQGYLVISLKEKWAMGKPKSQPCVECGAAMLFEQRIDEVAYQGHKRKVKVHGWWCTKCGEAILDGEALQASESAFLELKAEVDGVLGPSEVAKVRTKLGLSQRKAGELLGGGPRAFQKYEAGTQSVSVAMSHLLRLLANDPRRLAELETSKRARTPGVERARAPKARATARARSARAS